MSRCMSENLAGAASWFSASLRYPGEVLSTQYKSVSRLFLTPQLQQKWRYGLLLLGGAAYLAQKALISDMPTEFRYPNFESWDELADTFAKAYVSRAPITSQGSIEDEKQQARNYIKLLRTNDHDSFIAIVRYLHQVGFFEDRPRVFHQIVSVCVLLFKADVLQALHEIDPVAVVANRDARALLADPNAAEKQRLVEQFITGPGSMKEDGANAYLNALCYNDLGRSLDGFITQYLEKNNESNDDAWAYAFSSYLAQLRAVYKRYDRNQIAIINSFDDSTNPGASDKQFMSFIGGLEARLLASQSSEIVGSCLIAGGHFMCFQLKLEKNDNHEISATVLKIDGKGADWAQGLNRYESLLDEYLKGKVTLFASEELIQKAGKGCSFIAADHLRRMVNATTYDGDDLLGYVQNHTTGNIQMVSFDDFDRVTSFFLANTVRLPAEFCLMRQPMDDKHMQEDPIDHFPANQLQIGQRASELESGAPCPGARGRCGVFTDLKDRASEYAEKDRFGVGTNTLKSSLECSLGRQPNGKPANLGTERFSFSQGIAVVAPALRSVSKMSELSSYVPEVACSAARFLG